MYTHITSHNPILWFCDMQEGERAEETMISFADHFEGAPTSLILMAFLVLFQLLGLASPEFMTEFLALIPGTSVGFCPQSNFICLTFFVVVWSTLSGGARVWTLVTAPYFETSILLVRFLLFIKTHCASQKTFLDVSSPLYHNPRGWQTCWWPLSCLLSWRKSGGPAVLSSLSRWST